MDRFGIGRQGIARSPRPPPGPGGDLGTGSEAAFTAAMRRGVIPAGEGLAAEMPWRASATMTAAELAAIWVYLQSAPPVSGGAP